MGGPEDEEAHRTCVIVDETPAEERARMVETMGEPWVRNVERGDYGVFHGGRTFLCGRFKKEEICARCGVLSEVLCDWPVNGGTCDLPLCRKHALPIGDDLDLCPVHAEMFNRHGRMPENDR